MFSMSLPRSGLARKFGEPGVPGVSHTMGPTQSEFLSVLASAHFSDAHSQFLDL